MQMRKYSSLIPFNTLLLIYFIPTNFYHLKVPTFISCSVLSINDVKGFIGFHLVGILF